MPPLIQCQYAESGDGGTKLQIRIRMGVVQRSRASARSKSAGDSARLHSWYRLRTGFRAAPRLRIAHDDGATVRRPGESRQIDNRCRSFENWGHSRSKSAPSASHLATPVTIQSKC